MVIATGFYDIPVMMNIPGEDLPKVVHYYKDPHFYAMQKVLVVGANNSAVDAALETWRKGAEVSMVIRHEGIGKRVKYWFSPISRIVLRKAAVRRTTHPLVAIREKEVEHSNPQWFGDYRE